MKSKICLILVFLFLVTGIISAQNSIKLSNGEWEPYLSENLKHYGVASHIVTQAFQNAGIQVDYVFLPWKRAYEDAKAGKVHGSLIWSYVEERTQDFYYSDTVIISESVFFHLKSKNFEWSSAGDLKKYKIGGTIGYKYKFQEEPGGDALVLDEASSDELNFKKLLNNRIDAFPVSKDVGYAMITSNFLPREVKQFTHHSKPYDQTKFFLLLSRAVPENEQIVKKFNEGLAKLKSSGKYDKYLLDSNKGRYKKK